MRTRTILCLAILVLLLWGAGGFLIWRSFSDHTERGTFGDMFGAVNALFSGLALMGIIVAISFQKQELALQRRELTLTREELTLARAEVQGQREQMELQNETLRQQRLEQTLFQMLRLHHDIVESLTHDRETGRRVLQHYIGELVNNQQINRFDDTNRLAQLNRGLRDYFRQRAVTHIFRNLLEVLRFLDLVGGDAGGYAALVRAQLSDVERELLFYYALVLDPEMKSAIERHALMRGFDRVLDKRDRELYAPSAFGDEERPSVP